MPTPVCCEAYLDIETTGLAPDECEITVIGIYRWSEDGDNFIQLVGRDICSQAILEALTGVTMIYTYNGSRFDLPYIKRVLGLNLTHVFNHCDLMHHCWQKGLRGGLKKVEQQLGVKRRLEGLNGYDAVRLWFRYTENDDEEALKTLLEYNKEDVINLHQVRTMLLTETLSVN